MVFFNSRLQWIFIDEFGKNGLLCNVSLFAQFTLAISQFFTSFGFIRKHKLRHYYLFPICLSLLIITLAVYHSVYYMDVLSDYVVTKLGLEMQSVSRDAGFWENAKRMGLLAGEFVVFLLLKISLIYLFFRANKYIVLILLSPVMAFLSEKAEEILSGNEYPFHLGQFCKDVWRGILVATRNFVLEMSMTVVLLIIGLIVPWLSPFISVLLFFIGAYFYGFSTFDYLNERKRRSIKESVRYIRENKGAIIGNGTMFSIFMMIPFLGTVLGPLNATVGAVLTAHKMERK